MNKLSFLFSISILTASSVSAKHLTPHEALSRAMSEVSTGAAKAPASAKMDVKRTFVNSDNDATLYLFGDDANILVVPADDRVAPLLGYIDGNAEGEMPQQLEWWLDEYSRQISYVMSQPENGSGLYITPRNDASSSIKAPIAPLISTQWNQADPYNYSCPTIDGNKTMTGCVATAVAQVMKYHNYPAEGTGTISYNDNKTTRTLTLDGKPFDWENMLNSYNSYNSKQRDAIAYLMQAVGYACQMNYGADASSTYSEHVIAGITTYFGYSEKAQLLDRTNFSRNEWENIIYENLQKVGPLYYAGSDNLQGGHAFVCDGYSNGYFHFNWGWGGAYDGYFMIDALNPQGQGIGGNIGGFNVGQQIIANFAPASAQTIDLSSISPIILLGNLTAESTSNGQAIQFSSDMAETYNVFIYNSSATTTHIQLGLKAVNIATNEETYFEDSYDYELKKNSGFKNYSILTPSSLSNGDYRIYLVVRDYPSGEWTCLTHSISNVDYVNVSISNGIISNLSNAAPGVIDITDLSVESAVCLNYPIKLKYTASNSSVSEIYDGLTPYLFTINNNQANIKAYGNTMMVSLAAGESIEIESIPTLYQLEDFYGEAYVGIVSSNTGEIINYIPVLVRTSPEELSVTATNFSFVGNQNAADANNLQFDCSIKINTGYWVAPISVYICSAESTILHTLYSSETYFLELTDTASTIVSGSFPSAIVGETYTAQLCYATNGYIQAMTSGIDFTIANAVSGIGATTADAAEPVSVIADRNSATLIATAANEIESIEAYSLDGRRLPLDISIYGKRAEAPLTSLPDGIILVKVTLTDATSVVTKVVK